MINKKWFLFVTEFFSGLSVMAIEIGASRLLAPYFSSSQIVWTLIIGTIMIAMAIGNIWGGKSADKDPSLSQLYFRLLLAAVWVAAIPFLGKYVIAGISLVLALFVTSNYLVVAAMVSCLIIFVFPLMLLGTVTPSLTRYSIKNLNESGKLVGTLGALNTIGSIIGTFLPTFVTIPTVGTALTFIIFASILLALALTFFISKWIGDHKDKKKLPVKDIVKSSVSTLLFITFSLFGYNSSFAFWDATLLYEGESVYNYLRVYEDDNAIYFSTNVLFGVQSTHYKNPGLHHAYYDYALLAPYMTGLDPDSGLDVLVLGLGTGTYPSELLTYFDNVNIDGVEIDAKIIDLAHEYFELPDAVNAVEADGRNYLVVGEGKDKTYDIILCDAYQDISIPFQMASVEFFTIAKQHLSENGILMVNMNMYSDEPGSINQYLGDTVGTLFSEIHTIHVGSNRVLFASNEEDMLTTMNTALALETNNSLRNFLNGVKNNLEPYTPGDLILTDDKAPVEMLSMRVIDDMIQAEMDYYRQLLKENGIVWFLKEFI